MKQEISLESIKVTNSPTSNVVYDYSYSMWKNHNDVNQSIKQLLNEKLFLVAPTGGDIKVRLLAILTNDFDRAIDGVKPKTYST